MASGERYVLISREVLESTAYHATPHYARSVLLALAAQYYGSRNGSLALPIAEAATLGVRQSWHVYAGLRILCDCDLIVCTRRGHLERGLRLASMYALTWRGIDEPATGISYDAGISVCPIPTHIWARWTLPADWDARVRTIVDAARGAGNRDRQRQRMRKVLGRVSPPHVGDGRTHGVGTELVPVVPTCGDQEPRTSYPQCGDPLRSGAGAPAAMAGRAILDHEHLPDTAVAASPSIDIGRETLTRGRASTIQGRRS